MSPMPGAEQAQCLHVARAPSEETRRPEVVMVSAPQRNSSCTILIFVTRGMSGWVAGGTEMSLLTFYTFRFFFIALFGKGKPLLGRIHRFFCKWVLCVSPPPPPLMTDFRWWKGRMAEVLLKKEIAKEAKRLVFRRKVFPSDGGIQGTWRGSFRFWGCAIWSCSLTRGNLKFLVTSTLGNRIFIFCVTSFQSPIFFSLALLLFIIIILRNNFNNLTFSFKYSGFVLLKLVRCKDSGAPRHGNHGFRQTASLLQICICGLISHAVAVGISVYGGIRDVYCCFAKVSTKCTNCKFSPCKYTWLLGFLWELSCGFRFGYFSVTLQRYSQKHPPVASCCSQLQESLAAASGLMDGQSGDPWELWEVCDCNSYCSPYGGCARAHLLALWVSGTPDIRGWCPLLRAPPPSPLCSLIQKQQEAGSLCLTRSLKCPAGHFASKG